MQKRIIQCTKCQVLQSDNGFPSCKECGAKLYKENSKMNSTDQPQQPTAKEMLEELRNHWLSNPIISSADDILTYAEQWLQKKDKGGV